ncbi:HAD-IA family hydrolase [Paenibacillus apii]|uniref:HAD-IA family hydrolase n=1 Tax=Paenibacillus apii TaxID=1850370 RepID=UPI00197E5522|nr:HAD-IA family hydrolase [Paenibacillus apii]
MRGGNHRTEIKALLFDSGRVLNRPASGHWFITPNFFNVIDERSFKSIDKHSINNAFHTAGKYISEQSLIRNKDEEYVHFVEFYRIFSAELPQLGMDDKHVKSIAEDLVHNNKKYTFYNDAIELIPKLSEKYKLAVVSDAWPSLDHVYRESGLRDYFSSFIISSVLGVNKPHELMYKTALEELQLSPSEVLFIDDNIRNCDGAKELGIRAFLLCRDWKHYIYYKITCKNYPVIRNINELIKKIR